MAVPNRNKSHKKSSGSRTAALVILVLIVGTVAGYFYFSPTGPTVKRPQKAEPSLVTPAVPGKPAPLPAAPPITENKQSEYPVEPVVPEKEKSRAEIGPAGRLAIIIDDMGSNLSEARSLAAIKVPLTFAVIPGLRVDKGVAAYASEQNIEMLIHIPMQSKGWPARRLEANGLLVSMSNDEIQEQVSEFIQLFPEAVGVNNHMGSEFTEQEEKMSAVLHVLKKHNLFFIDSVTSPESVGLRTAQRLGVKSARRNVFLDNEQVSSYILGQLGQAAGIARKTGSAIAICHPHPATIAALAAALPRLASQGVKLVPVSQLVK